MLNVHGASVLIKTETFIQRAAPYVVLVRPHILRFPVPAIYNLV